MVVVVNVDEHSSINKLFLYSSLKSYSLKNM